jgi:hypothetical protein
VVIDRGEPDLIGVVHVPLPVVLWYFVSVIGCIGGAIVSGLALNQGWTWTAVAVFPVWGAGVFVSLRWRGPRARRRRAFVITQSLAAGAAFLLCLVVYTGLQDHALREHGIWEKAVVTSRSATWDSNTESYSYAYTLRAVGGPAIYGYLYLDTELPIGRHVTVLASPGSTANPSLSRPPPCGGGNLA